MRTGVWGRPVHGLDLLSLDICHSEAKRGISPQRQLHAISVQSEVRIGGCVLLAGDANDKIESAKAYDEQQPQSSS